MDNIIIITMSKLKVAIPKDKVTVGVGLAVENINSRICVV